MEVIETPQPHLDAALHIVVNYTYCTECPHCAGVAFDPIFPSREKMIKQYYRQATVGDPRKLLKRNGVHMLKPHSYNHQVNPGKNDVRIFVRYFRNVIDHARQWNRLLEMRTKN